MQIDFMMVKESSGKTVKSASDAAGLMRKEGKIDRECFWVLHFNTKNKLTERELVSMGTLNASFAEPREVFRKAVKNGAASILTVHNHPSGSTNPSREDKKVWENLNRAGKLLNIPVLDHLIITPSGSFFSWKENEPEKVKGGDISRQDASQKCDRGKHCCQLCKSILS